MLTRSLLLFSFCAIAACSSSTVPDSRIDVGGEDVQNDAPADVSHTKDVSPDSTTDTTAEDTGPAVDEGCGGAETVVSFETSDGVTLAADFTQAQKQNRPAVVLLHMIPPSNDRTGYPPRVRAAIAAGNVSVINVDRRGAGDSGGSPNDAHTGDTARLDAEAAVKYLVDQTSCTVDPTNIVLVGASNGTTTVMDYTVNRSDSTLPDPKALIWLSPGSYTENQNTVADNIGVLGTLPILILYPSSEPWSETYIDQYPSWKLVEILSGSHGTRNFDDGRKEAIQLPEIVDWISQNTGG